MTVRMIREDNRISTVIDENGKKRLCRRKRLKERALLNSTIEQCFKYQVEILFPSFPILDTAPTVP